MNNLFKYVLGVIAIKSFYDIFTTEEKSIQRRIFISHSWKKGSEDYLSFKKKLKKHNIKIYDHSIPQYKAFDENGR